MLVQMAGLLEAFVALWAFVWTMFSMVEKMFFKVFLCLVNPFTHSTVKGTTT